MCVASFPLKLEDLRKRTSARKESLRVGRGLLLARATRGSVPQSMKNTIANKKEEREANLRFMEERERPIEACLRLDEVGKTPTMLEACLSLLALEA